MTLDMTRGNPLRSIVLFSIPMLIGGVFQLFYNLTDTLVVGRTIGSQALAAVGATTSATFFLTSVALGFTSAFSIVISQRFGAADKPALRRAVISSIYLTLAASLLLALAGIFGARPLLVLLQTPADILDDAAAYLRICMGCSVGLIVYNGAAGILRAVGNSRTPLFVLIFCTLLNIGLDLLFVLVFHLGVPGVAIATVLSQLCSAAVCVFLLVRQFRSLSFTRADLSPDWDSLREITVLGLSMGAQSVLLSIGEMTVTGAINVYGSDVVAAFTTVNRFTQFATISYLNFAGAFSVFAGQNFGARRFDRIKKGFRETFLIILVLSVLSAVLSFLFGDHLVRLFLSEGDTRLDSVLGIARGCLRVYSVFFPALGVILLYNNTLRGMGDAAIPFLSGMVELALKVGGALVLSALFGYFGIWFANPLGWALGIIPSAIRYHLGRWAKEPAAEPAAP